VTEDRLMTLLLSIW